MADIGGEWDKIIDGFRQLKMLAPEVRRGTDLCVETLRAGGKIMFCGNGGSASQAQHLAAELVGRYKIDRPAMAAAALTVDTSILTAVGNDYGFDVVFARQVEGIGRAGDLLIGLSTSGNSKNVILAFEAAKQKNIRTLAMTGRRPSRLSELADFTLAMPSDSANSIQEMHLVVGHLICGEVERAFYGE